jgi:hypothetical protein
MCVHSNGKNEYLQLNIRLRKLNKIPFKKKLVNIN